jgi:hypothetical protein
MIGKLTTGWMFFFYSTQVSIGATIGYFAGIATYLAQYEVLNGGFFQNILPQAVAAVDVVQLTGAM